MNLSFAIVIVAVSLLCSGARSEPYASSSEDLNKVNMTFLRETILGVPSSAQGSSQSTQGIILMPGLVTTIISESSVNDFLDEQLPEGVTHTELVLPSWAPMLDQATCNETYGDFAFANCGFDPESMLDIESQMTMAPGATTVYIPSQFATKWIEDALRNSGYSETEIQKLWPELVNLLDNAQESDYTDMLKDFDPKVQLVIEKSMTAWFKEFMRNLTTIEPIPQVITMSFGASYPLAGIPAEVIEDELKKLTLDHGITLISSSGDSGASGESNDCLPADNPLTANNQVESSPKRSPWVTVVGGIMLNKTGDSFTEMVCSAEEGCGVTSGGGFAAGGPEALYSRPAWQNKAVTEYLASNNPTTFAGFPAEDTPGFNPGGRAYVEWQRVITQIHRYPDIAFYSDYIPVNEGKGTVFAAGTSFSSPATGALITLVNEQLVGDGYETVGYLNPMIYWMGENCTEAFNDVTIGNNQGGKGNGKPLTCLFGYPAASGWDPATGFGSIKFEPFIACAKRYQDEVRSKGLELLPDGTYRSLSSSKPSNIDSTTSNASSSLVLPVLLGIAASTLC